MKEYIGIDGITLYKINDDGTSEKKTFSDQNGLVTILWDNIKPNDYLEYKKFVEEVIAAEEQIVGFK